jgi:hypothetical protein
MPFPGFTLSDIAAIEHFVEAVNKREQQIAKSTGISGSFAKAFLDVTREVRAAGTRLRHADRAQATTIEGGNTPLPDAP